MLPYTDTDINMGADIEVDVDIDVDTFDVTSRVWALQGFEPQTPAGSGAVLCHHVAWP